MTTDNAFTARFFEDHNLRMLACWWLAAFPRNCAPDELQDALFDSMFDEEVVGRLFPRAVKNLCEYCVDEDGPLPGEFVEAIVSNGYLGFLVHIKSLAESNGFYNDYHLLWGYGETICDAIYSALRSLDEIRAKVCDLDEQIAGLYVEQNHG